MGLKTKRAAPKSRRAAKEKQQFSGICVCYRGFASCLVQTRSCASDWFLGVNQFHAAVFSLCFVVQAFADGFFFAKTDGFHLAFGHT